MGFFSDLKKISTIKRDLVAHEESDDANYFRQQLGKLAIERDMHLILEEYYDKDTCEMIPVKVPAWGIPIVAEILDSNGISYIVKEDLGEVDIIHE